jgi:hypothetical protein
MKAPAAFVGIVCGAFVGLVLGFLVAYGLGRWSQWAHPNDASAGSVAIVVILTAPGGAVLGAVFGCLTIAKRPRLFLFSFLPLAVIFLGVLVTFETLQRMDRPRAFLLEIQGTLDADYVGVVSVDGEAKELNGKIPGKFECEGFRVELAFALVNRKGEDSIAVRVYADGRELNIGHESQTGVSLALRSFGYSQDFGGTSSSWSRMSPEEADGLVKHRTIPAGMWVP